MTKLMRALILSAIIMPVLASCFPSNTNSNQVIQATPALPAVVTIELIVQADDTAAYESVGQVITYYYNIKNTGAVSMPGPVTATGTTLTCPEINTVGNLDNALDFNETLICTAAYTITQADLNQGSVTNTAMVALNGINSNQVTTTLITAPPTALTLTKTANPVTYDHVGQAVTYTYVITNNSAEALGPAQFTVSDTGISAPIHCGEATVTLASNATVTCSATYTISQADIDSASVSTSATASGGNTGASQSVSATITKSAVNSNPANLIAGSTIQHQVRTGEWLWQIARCYGVDPNKVSAANPQLSNPAQISPNTTVSVPNIGSVGKIYGLPCVGTHTVQSGDTWNSIALQYNADSTVLQMVNANTLTVGRVIKVPLNSAGGATKTTDGATGYCVDLSRSLKLAGLNANITHFNICGGIVPNVSGNMKIGTINIYQRLEDVGLGGLLQDITLPAIETSTPINDANSLIVGDMNYDGNDDFRIVKNQPAGPNIPYIYYIYDPATRKFVYNEAYGKVTSPEFPGNSEIRSQWRESAAKWGIDTYFISNNNPILTQRETWEAINETQAKHQVLTFNAEGSSLVVIDEIIPLPIP